MQRVARLIGIVAVSFLAGSGLGYFGYEWLHRIDVFKNGDLKAISDAKIPLLVARERITSLRKSGSFVLDPNQSWEVKRTTFDAILSQVDALGAPLESIQFYPAYAEDSKSLTLVLVGRSPNGLVLKRQFKNTDGTITELEGELWDYIGPCPPRRDCPQNEEILVK